MAPKEPTDREYVCDGVLQRSFDAEFKLLDEDNRVIEVIASSEALDGHGDVVKQFWDFTRFEKNPCILWNHNKFGVHHYSYEGSVRPEDLMPIGQALEWKVSGKKLIVKIKLGSAEYSPIAQRVFLGCKERVIRAVSVGFRAGSVTAIKDKAGHIIRFELGSAENPNVLHEVSFVPIGSNPDAVAKAMDAERKYLTALVEKNDQPEARAPKETAVNEEQLKAAHAAEIKTAMDLATASEKRATDAEAQIKALGDSLAAEKARADKAEADLKAEKAASAVLEKDLADAKATLDAQREAASVAMVKSYVGTKLAPTEEEEYVQLAKDLGAERAEKLIKGRPDLAVTKPATAGGQPIKSSQPGSLDAANPGEALLKAAKAKAAKAA